MSLNNRELSLNNHQRLSTLFVDCRLCDGSLLFVIGCYGGYGCYDLSLFVMAVMVIVVAMVLRVLVCYWLLFVAICCLIWWLCFVMGKGTFRQTTASLIASAMVIVMCYHCCRCGCPCCCRCPCRCCCCCSWCCYSFCYYICLPFSCTSVVNSHFAFRIYTVFPTFWLGQGNVNALFLPTVQGVQKQSWLFVVSCWLQ